MNVIIGYCEHEKVLAANKKHSFDQGKLKVIILHSFLVRRSRALRPFLDQYPALITSVTKVDVFTEDGRHLSWNRHAGDSHDLAPRKVTSVSPILCLLSDGTACIRCINNFVQIQYVNIKLKCLKKSVNNILNNNSSSRRVVGKIQINTLIQKHPTPEESPPKTTTTKQTHDCFPVDRHVTSSYALSRRTWRSGSLPGSLSDVTVADLSTRER